VLIKVIHHRRPAFCGRATKTIAPGDLLIEVMFFHHPSRTRVLTDLTFWRHRNALRAAVERMIAWQPERIIIAHGRWYEGNYEAELRRAFRWVLRN
jgi:hypothetical protein